MGLPCFPKTRRSVLHKQLKQLHKELRCKTENHPVQMGNRLLESGQPLAFLSYVQIPRKNRPSFPKKKSRQSWPDGLEDELAETLAGTNIYYFWMDKMGYPDIKTLGPASGLRPYAMDNGLVVVRGAFGEQYAGYHFVGKCGTYLEMVVQAVMEPKEHLEALRWTASSRLWPSAEVAVGIMHGRIKATPKTVRAARVLIHGLDKAIRQLQSTSSVRKDMGFTFFKRRVKCKACGNVLKFPDSVNWRAAIVGVIRTKDRIQRWIDMIENCNGGLAENFLTHYVVGPMWEADCYDEADRVPVASLTYFMWLEMGSGGTEIYRNITNMVGKPDALVHRLMACIGNTERPRFWYESFDKMVHRVVEQTALSAQAKFGAQSEEWAHAVWYYPSSGRGFFGDLTFSPGKELVLKELSKIDPQIWHTWCFSVIVDQQRSLWPVVGVSLPWYFTTCNNMEIVLVPALMSPTSVDGRSMGIQKGEYQYCIAAEVTRSGEIVIQVPFGGSIQTIRYDREGSQLYYLAFAIEGQDLKLVALRPCYTSTNTSWANIDPESICNPPQNRHTPYQNKMYGANGSPRDFSNLYKTVWVAKNRDFAHLGCIDDRALFSSDIVNPDAQIAGQSVGWNWNPVPNQELAAEKVFWRARNVLRAWTRPWL